MKRLIAPLIVVLLAYPATALADSPLTSRVPDVASDLRAPDQRTPSDPAPRLEASGTDVAAPDQQASTRSPTPVPVPVPATAPAADGFDWADAGIGVAGAAALFMLAGAIVVRRRRPQTLAG